MNDPRDWWLFAVDLEPTGTTSGLRVRPKKTQDKGDDEERRIEKPVR